jgi:AcrR family transcriptional regulator
MEILSVASPTVNRTQQAILETAIRVLGQDPSASLRTIAQEARVGRTTLHRYFADRAALTQAVNAFAREQFRAVITRARLDEGSGLEAFVRLGTEYYEISDVLAYAFNEPAFMEEEAAGECGPEDDRDARVLATIERGQADGSIDPAQPGSWIISLLWAVLYSAWHYQVTEKTTRHETLQLIVRSLRKVAANPTS